MSKDKKEKKPGKGISDLPKFLKKDISNRLDEKSQSKLALSSKMFGHGISQKDRIKTKLLQCITADSWDMIEKLLEIKNIQFKLPFNEIQAMLQPLVFTLAGNGEQDKLETILKVYPEFLLASAPLKDISGVELVIDGKEGITLFQHAIWARDVRYMSKMMLDCLPKTQEGEEIRLQLLEQCNELMDKGVVYELNGETRREKQFSLKPLIEALQTFVEKFDYWTWEAREVHWCAVVGLAQTLLPANLRQHYCDPEESFENQNFKNPRFKRSLKFYNFLKEEVELWSASLEGLGSNIGISRGIVKKAVAGGMAHVGMGSLIKDLAALITFDKVRTEDLEKLIQRVQRPIQIREEKQVRPPGNY